MFEVQRKVLRHRWSMTFAADEIEELLPVFDRYSVYPNEAVRLAEYDDKHHMVRVHRFKAGRIMERLAKPGRA